MAENKPQFETQHERWLKYGANVVIASIVVILLAGLITYFAQRSGRRLDTTATRAYSLKPQTLNILSDVKGKTKIVSLYRDKVPEKGEMKKSPYAEPVADLLEEYQRHSNNIDIDVIDPVSNNAKVESLISEVSGKYGGEIKKYQQVIDAYPAVYAQLKTIVSAEAEKVAKLPAEGYPQDDDGQNEQAAVSSPQTLLRRLTESDEKIKRSKGEKPPDYRGITDEIGDQTNYFADISKQIIDIFAKAKDDKRLPEPIRQYMATAAPAYAQIQKLSDGLNKQTKDLGALKLDDLRTSLKAKDVVLVIGDNDMRVIPFDQMWKVDDKDIKQYAPGQEIKPRFAGEQQISSAILTLNQNKKQKIVFIRNGGAPLTNPGSFPFQRGGPMSEIAARLREYNFDVMEKDITGMWAMQAQMQQMPAEPEPSDEQIKDAIWVVMNFPADQQQQQQMPTPPLAPKVAEHMKAGGSAMILFAPRADNMTDLMKEWGMDVHAEAVAVHQTIKTTNDTRQGDVIEEAQKYPFVFNIRDYGDTIITRPLKSLDSLLLPLMCVKVPGASGVKATPIIPIPTNPPSWGETDLESLQNMTDIAFDPAKDIASPIFGGAIAEKDKAGRLVVIASPTFAFDRYINEPDPALLKQGLVAAHFPANAELFSNSIFWLAKMDSMIAISPSAMEVARIEPMSETSKNLWKVGVLLIGLPGLVILAGALVWFVRQD